MTESSHKSFRNNVTNEILSAKKNFYTRKFDKFRSYEKKTWRVISSDLGRKEAVNNFQLSVEGVPVRTLKQMCNVFNK